MRAYWVTLITHLIVTVTPLFILRVHMYPRGRASAASLLAQTWPSSTRLVSGVEGLVVGVVVVVVAVFIVKTYAWVASKGAPGEWTQRPSLCMRCGSIQRRWIPGWSMAVMLAALCLTGMPPSAASTLRAQSMATPPRWGKEEAPWPFRHPCADLLVALLPAAGGWQEEKRRSSNNIPSRAQPTALSAGLQTETGWAWAPCLGPYSTRYPQVGAPMGGTEWTEGSSHPQCPQVPRGT